MNYNFILNHVLDLFVYFWYQYLERLFPSVSFCKRVDGVTLSAEAAAYIKEKFFITISITNNKNILKYCAF